MSAAQAEGIFFAGDPIDDAYLGDRQAQYEFKRILIRRLQQATRGMQRRERFRVHRDFIDEWTRLRIGQEALSHLPLVAALLDGTLSVNATRQDSVLVEGALSAATAVVGDLAECEGGRESESLSREESPRQGGLQLSIVIS